MRSEKLILEERAKTIQSVKDKWKDVKTRDDKNPTEDELAFFNKADVDIRALTDEWESVKSVKETETRMGDYEGMLGEKVAEAKSALKKDPKKDTPEARNVLDKFMRKGLRSLTTEERSVFDSFEKRGTDTLIASGDALGGYTVPEEWASSLYKEMLWYGGALEAAGISIRSSQGGVYHAPYVGDTGNTGAIIGETASDVVLDTTFGDFTLNAYDYTSKMIKVSWDLIEDSEYDVQSAVREIAAERVGRILNTHFTTGTGTGQPKGFVTASTLGKTAASATAVTRQELIDLIHSVDKSHRSGPKVGFQFSDATLASFKKLSIGSADDRPLWSPSMREGEPDRIDGQKYWVNNDMPAMTSGLKSIVFGNFGSYKVRQVGGFRLARSTDRYIEERAVVFFVFARFDGDLQDTAAIKHLIQA